MSQGMKQVTVLDSEACVPRQIAVDEARWNEVNDAFVRIGLDKILKGSPHFRSANDATEGMAFLVSQLAYTEAEVYRREYQDMQFRELLPVTSEAGPDAVTVRYQIYDRVGRGKRISANAKDLPKADVAAAVQEIGVVPGGISYGYTQEELLLAARMIRPLPTERAAAAVEASERHLNDVALIGEQADIGSGQASYTGLLTLTGVTTHNDGTAGYNKAWSNSSTTFDEILADVNKAILAYWTASNYTLFPDTFGLAPQCFSPLATRYNALGTRTLLQLLEESNLATARTKQPLKFIPIVQASDKGVSGAGVTGKSRCVLYRNDKRRIVHHVPMPLRFLAPQLEGLNVDIPGWYKYAGVNLRFLYSLMYLDNMD